MKTELLRKRFREIDWVRSSKELNLAYFDPGKNIVIEAPTGVNQRTVEGLQNVLIGRNTYRMPTGMHSPNIIIGRYCSIAHFVNIGATHHDFHHLSTGILSEDMSETPESQKDKEIEYTIIGCDVWIGVNASILGGAKIGHGACVGAGAVVKKEIPPYAIVGGVPARIIKYRFTDEIIADLLDLEWWTFEPNIIANLPKDDIRESIVRLKEIKKIEKS